MSAPLSPLPQPRRRRVCQSRRPTCGEDQTRRESAGRVRAWDLQTALVHEVYTPVVRNLQAVRLEQPRPHDARVHGEYANAVGGQLSGQPLAESNQRRFGDGPSFVAIAFLEGHLIDGTRWRQPALCASWGSPRSSSDEL